MSAYVDRLMADVEAKNPGELEFHQAVREVATSIELLLDRSQFRVERLCRIGDRLAARLIFHAISNLFDLFARIANLQYRFAGLAELVANL